MEKENGLQPHRPSSLHALQFRLEATSPSTGRPIYIFYVINYVAMNEKKTSLSWFLRDKYSSVHPTRRFVNIAVFQQS
jgi:hypothetical protein